MKKIINGKRYDSDKALLVGYYKQGYPGDFNAWEASLYKTPRSGQFFLVGTGGPMTMFAASHSDGSRSGGSDLVPISLEHAREWAEKHLSLVEIEKAFNVEDA